jgi:hypothetical protein
VVVRDTTPPAVTVPVNITTDAMSPSGAVVTFTASAFDIVDGSVTPTCAPLSGTTFAIGTTTVMCTAIDAHHNASAKSFTVTVLTPAQMTANTIAATIQLGFQQSSRFACRAAEHCRI